MRLRACILAIAVVTPLRAFAQTPPPAPPPEAAPPPPPPVVVAPPPEAPPPSPPAVAVAAPMAPAAPAAGPKITWGGLVDTYYMYLFNKGSAPNTLVGALNTPTTPNVRQFDVATNSASLSLAALTVNAAMDPVAFQLDMGYGTTGAIINSVNNSPTAQGNFIILQAYGTITVLPQLTLDFGKFYTTAGAEVVPANKNWLYSRSFLFFNIPLLHTGARANFKVNDQLSLQASLVNGWNDDPDFNAWKTVGLSATFTASPMAAFTATTYFGKERTQVTATNTPSNIRLLINVITALTLS
ncbi:MAG TPA: outer membrane beta-barrel protein, partial [Polyangia bacterium]|nr:outer membrane beta-barrel protein [Polyangia bacterium]